MKTYTVLLCRKTWDQFKVNAATPSAAAMLVARGKVVEEETDIHTLYRVNEIEGTVTVINPEKLDDSDIPEVLYVGQACDL